MAPSSSHDQKNVTSSQEKGSPFPKSAVEILEDELEQGHALDERMSLTTEFIRTVNDAVEEEEEGEVKRLCSDLRPADVADLFEQLPDASRPLLTTLLGDELEAEQLLFLKIWLRQTALKCSLKCLWAIASP